jgi:protein FAM50
MGDFSAHFHRPESGIHTVEGNVAGSRAASLTKKRQLDQQAFEAKKRQIETDYGKSATKIHDKFAGESTHQAEQSFKSKTVGLVTAEEFKRLAREKNEPNDTDGAEEKVKVQLTAEQQALEEKKAKKMKRKKLKEKKKMMSTLSFAGDQEEEALVMQDETESSSIKKKANLKDPTVDTSFLPDKQREEEYKEERRRLEQEWKQKQEEMKQQDLEIVYSYWDGSGHRRTVRCKKGDTIGSFLEQVRKSLVKEFRELQSTSVDGLLYVKEDLILPHDLTFYDLIATKARGKSGPLFHFDVHEDVRLGAIDSRVEKDEAHPGKVVERQWYDRNKHIFPASRWEVFDPAKDYGGYTIHGKEVNNKKKV